MLWDNIQKLLNLRGVAKYTIGTNDASLTVLTNISNHPTLHMKNIMKAANVEEFPRKRSAVELDQATSQNDPLEKEERVAKAAKINTQGKSYNKETTAPFSLLGYNPSFEQFVNSVLNTSNVSSTESDTSIETRSPESTTSGSNQGSQTLPLEEALAQEEVQESSDMNIEATEMAQAIPDEDQNITCAPRIHRKPATMKEGLEPFSFGETNAGALFLHRAEQIIGKTRSSLGETDTSIELTSPESTNSDTRQNSITTSAENALVEGLANMSVGFRPFNKANKPTFISKVKVAERAPSPILEETEVLTNKTVTSLFASPDFDTPGILRPDETPIDQLEQKFDEVFSMLFPKPQTAPNKASKGIAFTAVVDNGEDLYYEEDDYGLEEDYYSSDEEMSCAGEVPSYPQLD